MKLEEEINKLIAEIESGLLEGRINTTLPHVSLDYQNKLATYSSTAMGLIEKYDTLEAEFFVNKRSNYKSDTAVNKAWKVSKEGIRQVFWSNRISRMKILIKTLEKTYYSGRDEQKQKTLN